MYGGSQGMTLGKREMMRRGEEGGGEKKRQ